MVPKKKLHCNATAFQHTPGADALLGVTNRLLLRQENFSSTGWLKYAQWVNYDSVDWPNPQPRDLAGSL